MVFARKGAFGVLGFSTVAMALSVGFCAGWVFGGRGANAETQARPLQAVPLLSSGQTIVGETISYPSVAAKITAAIVTIPPGAETGLHRHGVPTFGYMIEGVLTVDYGEKGQKVLKAGDAVLEAIEVPHNGRNMGSAPVRILAVYMGADGRPTTIPVK